MTTARDLLTSAAKKAGIIGVGQTLSAEDMNDAFNDMNQMIAQWRRKRWIVYHLVDTGFLANGDTYYTVGDEEDYDISPRPDRIEYAYFNQVIQNPPNNPVSYPLDILESYEDYASIELKSLQSWPEVVFYDSDFPIAKLYVWPIPNSGQYNVHILTKANLMQFDTLNTTVNLPLEYEAALIWNTVLRLRASYPRAQTDPAYEDDLRRLARDSLNVLRQANTQIPRLGMPSDLVRRGLYNVYSNRSV